MSPDRETREQLALESERRARLAVPVTSGGVLYLIGAIIIANQLQGLPTVGVIQGLEPALKGHAHAAVSPRAEEVRYLSHHAFGLIAGGVLQALGYAALAFGLLFLLSAIRNRAPEPSPAARWLVIVGGAGAATIAIVGQVVRAIRTHEFVVGHNFTDHAVEKAAYTGVANVTVEFLTLLLPLLLVIGLVLTVLRAARVGLIPRWLRTFGIIGAVLMLPFFTATLYTLQVIPAGFIVALGFLMMGRLPGGDPPAWAAGEAIPWPSAASRGGGAPERESADGVGSGSRGGDAENELAENGSQGALAGGGASSGKRRKRRRGRS